MRLEKNPGRTVTVLMLSAAVVAGCSGDPETASPTPSRTPSATAPRTAAPAPATGQPSPPAVAAPAPPTGELPVHPAPAVPEAPAPLTADAARQIVADSLQNSPDLVYDVLGNPDGSFDVKVRARSIMEQGGSGTVGLYTVSPSGAVSLK